MTKPVKTTKLLRKGVVRIRTLLKEIRFWWLNQFSNKRLSFEESCDVVISLTTFPARINKVFLTIESLFRQEMSPSVVHLWLSKEEVQPSKLPASLRRLKKRGLKITFVEENLKSYKKLVYALEYYPDFTIVTADDDILYPENWLGKLWQVHEKHPDDVVCYQGHYILFDADGKMLPYNSFMKKGDGEIGGGEASYELFPTGLSGVLYPPHSLHEIVTDQEQYLKLAPLADDIWFKCCSLLNNRKCRRVMENNCSFDVILGTKNTSLMKTNVKQGYNDEQLKNVFEAHDIMNRFFNKRE